MKIALITPYADPEIGAAVVRVNSFRETFQKAGHTVTVLAPHRNVVTATGTIRYHNIPHLALILLRSRYDVVMGTSPPITHNFFALLASRLKRVPFILDAKDPFTYLVSRFPHMKKGKTKHSFYRFFEDATHKRANHIFVLTPRDKENVEAAFSLPPEKVSVIRNGSDPTRICPNPAARRRLRKKLGIPPTNKVILYSGVIGGKNLSTLLERSAPVIKKQRAHLLFLFTHDHTPHTDAHYEAFCSSLERLGLKERAHIMLNTPYHQLASYLSVGDLALNPIPRFWVTNLPTKVFDYLAASLPLATMGPATGSMHDFHQTYAVGFFASDWNTFTKNLDKALHDPYLKNKGKRGREIIKKHFSRPTLNRKALAIFEEVA